MAEGNAENQVSEEEDGRNKGTWGCNDCTSHGVTPGNDVADGATSSHTDENWIYVETAEVKRATIMRKITAKDAKVLRPLSVFSWEGSAISNSHLWYSVDTSESCYLDSCSDPKATKEGKVRCSACTVVAHFGCKAQLVGTQGVVCKETFREIKQKVKDVTVLHHFLLRTKAAGRCKLCGKGFGTRVFSAKDTANWSCSWCGDRYHLACLSGDPSTQPCHMGPLKNMIVPPSWIVRTPMVEGDHSSVRDSNEPGHTPNHTPSFANQSPTNSPRKNSRKKRRSLYEEDRASKLFVVKPMMQEYSKPLVVFVNPKSGGNQGAKLLQIFHWLLNPRQVFDLTNGGPMFGLKMFIHVPNLRILVCGGDGTVGWVLSVLDEILEQRKQEFDRILDQPPVAILPLGTGNDLARVLGWGGGFSGGSLERILMSVESGEVTDLDRWLLFVVPNKELQCSEAEPGAVSDVPLHVVNNYFSIGADGSVALEFHLGREANPEKYKMRMENKFHYLKLGSKDMVQRKFINFTDFITLKGDGVDYTEKLQQLKIETLCFLNIPSYASGTNPWGHPSSEDKNISPQAIDDGMIEVVGFWATSMAMLQVGLGHGVRIAQCQHIKLTTSKCIPVQVDGEACMLMPSTIILMMKNKVPMVMKGLQRGSLSDVSPEECQQDRIQLAVYKVSIDVYEKCSSFQQARKLATDLGVILSTMESTLKDIRPQINDLISHACTTNGADDTCDQSWTFLNAAQDGIQQVRHEDELSLHVEDMPLDGVVILDVPCRSPPLQVGMAEASQKTASADMQCLITETEQFMQWNIHKSIFKAAMKGDLLSLKKLHEQGNSLFIVDNLRRSPLHYAARHGKEEVVRYLVTNILEEQINITDTESGQSPLHKAAMHDHLDICKILVENGASIFLQDTQGYTPYAVSVEHHSTRVQEYLKGLMNSS